MIRIRFEAVLLAFLFFIAGAAGGAAFDRANARPPAPLPPGVAATVRVAAASDDLAFLQDPQVEAEFARHGLDIEATGFGSGQIAESVSARSYDAFLLPDQASAAEVQSRIGSPVAEFEPFSTTLAVFTWKRLIPLLRAAGIINSKGQFDVSRYLTVVSRGLRWNQIPDNTFYDNPDKVLLAMADPADSDSGAMFVAAASYLLNGAQVVSGSSRARLIAAGIRPAINALGEMPPTTSDIFITYLSTGMLGMPMILGYTSESKALTPGAISSGATQLPLAAPVDAVATITPFDSTGTEFAELMTEDPILLRLADEYGFQTARALPKNQSFAIPLPAPSIMEELIKDIEN